MKKQRQDKDELEPKGSVPQRLSEPSRNTPIPPSQPSSVNLPNVRMARPQEWKRQKFEVSKAYFFIATRGEEGSPRQQRITSFQVEVIDNGLPRRFELRVDGNTADFQEVILGIDTEKREA